MPSGTAYNPEVKHMFVVCTGHDTAGNIVLVPVSSWKNELCDNSCRLDPGCHTFIKRDSYILYRSARIENALTIERGLKAGIFVPLKPVSSSLCDRITLGFAMSKQVSWQIKRHLKLPSRK